MEEDFYRGVVEGMSCGVLTLDADGRLLTLNSHARQILALGKEPVEGRACAEALATHPRVAEVLLESFSRTTLPTRAELTLTDGDGDERTIGFSITRIHDRAGSLIGAAMFFKDLTQVERQEEQDRLRDRLAALGEMAAQMAHEIRNPIASIAVTGQLLRRKLVAAGESVKPAERIKREVERVERTIASCLEYVRPVQPALRPEPLEGVLRQAADDARRRCRPADVTIDIDCQPGLDAVPCDAPRLTDVFTSLIGNSIEAMEGRGRITIRAGFAPSPAGAPGETCVVVRLEDTGPGIPPSLRDRIFYPFYTTKTTGTGIGLAVARKVIEAHRGMIDVSGGPGEGAAFTIVLPMAGPAREEGPSEPVEAGLEADS